MTINGIYSQRDARWGNLELGYNTDPNFTIYHFGCAIVSASNLLVWKTGDWNLSPAWVNNWLKSAGGYAPGGGLLIWGKLAELLGAYGIVYHGYTSDLNATNRWLSPENAFAIAQLTKPGFPMHFSAMPYVGQIADSWDAKLKPVTSYSFVGAHLYSFVVPQAVAPVVPPTEPAPIQAPVAPPAVPVASTEVPVPNPDPETETPVELEADWRTSWTPLEQVKAIARDGAYAINIDTGERLVNLAQGYRTLYAGSVEKNGTKYYRTPLSVSQGTWNGVAAEWFDEPTGQVNGSVPVKVVSYLKDDLFKHLDYSADTFKEDVAASVGLLTKFKDAVSKLIAGFIKPKSKGTV